MGRGHKKEEEAFIRSEREQEQGVEGAASDILVRPANSAVGQNASILGSPTVGRAGTRVP